mmetsp:Transcript_26602/g.61631  ORF Transcript_26602/g.61631 Transcript_26602/m.61631 type:complete len:254 (-) Transcript_26602:255-1016(-)
MPLSRTGCRLGLLPPLLLLLQVSGAAAWLAQAGWARRHVAAPFSHMRTLSCSLSDDSQPTTPQALPPSSQPMSRRDVAKAAAAVSLLSCTQQIPPALSKELPPYTSNFTLTDTGLKYRDVRVGTGPVVRDGCKVNFHFVGRLVGRNGKPFEDSTQGEPFRATLGRGELIEGLEEGLAGMRAGGSRRMLIPGEIGYKDKKQGPVPRDFGMRNRLYSTVFNKERTVKERDALGASIAGVVLADVQVLRVFCGADE